jgi:hypothetical protein
MVMCDQDAAVAGGNRQHFRVLETSEASCSSGPEIDFGIAAGDGGDDDLVESATR